MCTQLAGSRMIGQNGNGDRFFPIFHRFINRTYGAAIQIFNGQPLQRKVSFMSRLIAGLDMQVNEIIRFQCVKSGSHFILVIGIVQSGRSFHRQAAQSGIIADTVNQIYGRDYSTFPHLRKLIRKCFHLRTITRAPRPNTVSRVFAFGCTLPIDGVFFQQFLRTHD